MLNEYFALEITEDGNLVTIPLLLKGYTPSLAKLPSFILRLGPNVSLSLAAPINPTTSLFEATFKADGSAKINSGRLTGTRNLNASTRFCGS
jgi:DNA mismatch repair protein Mlh1 C-terminus